MTDRLEAIISLGQQAIELAGLRRFKEATAAYGVLADQLEECGRTNDARRQRGHARRMIVADWVRREHDSTTELDDIIPDAPVRRAGEVVHFYVTLRKTRHWVVPTRMYVRVDKSGRVRDAS